MSNNADKLIPIDFSRNITPFVIGDVMNHAVAGRFTLETDDQVKNFNNGNLLDNDYSIVSFADRPNTGERPVGDDVAVDVASEDGYKIAVITSWALGLKEGRSIKSWKPHYPSVLKQYQAEQLESVASDRLININEANLISHDDMAAKFGDVSEIKYDGPSPYKNGQIVDVRTFGAILDETPVFTQATKDHYKAWDGKENLDIGMAYTNGGGTDCMFIGFHAGIIIGRPLDMSHHDKLYLSTSDSSLCKPIDNRTDDQKIIAALLSIWEDEPDRPSIFSAILSSDEFTITLKE